MDTEKMDIDRNKFISEIKNRPAIWNTQCAEYNDKFHKIKQWAEIIEIYKPGATETEKKICRYNLQMKWKNIRDTFIKEYKRLNTKRNSDARRKCLYKHYNQLQFLMPCITMLRTKSKPDNDERKKSKQVPKKKKILKIPLESNETMKEKKRSVIAEDAPISEYQSIDEDPDRHFMLSLVQDFKRVPDRLKCIVKVNILKCIIEAQEHSVDFDAVHIENDGLGGENITNEEVSYLKMENPDDSTQSEKTGDSSISSDLDS